MPGFSAFIIGLIVFWGLSHERLLEIVPDGASIYPGILLSLCFLGIAAGLSFLAYAGLVALSTVVFKNEAEFESLGVLIASIAQVVGSMLPLFMYASYVKLRPETSEKPLDSCPVLAMMRPPCREVSHAGQREQAALIRRSVGRRPPE
jgi:hypothetical protein